MKTKIVTDNNKQNIQTNMVDKTNPYRVRFVSYEADKASNIYSMTTVSLFVFLPLLIVSVLNVALYRVSVR